MTALRLFTFCALAGGTAFAQTPPTDPPPPELPVQPPEPEPQPQPQPQPPQPPPLPVVREVPAVEAEPPPLVRPSGFSIGIGVGYRFPTALSIPNSTSVRFRLPSGITFEPSLVLATSSQELDIGMSQKSTSTELGVAALARFPVVQRRRTDLEILAAFGVDRLNQDPSDQNIEDQTTTTSTTFSYGVAVGLWLTQNLQVSLSATNALVSYVHTREEMGFDFVSVTNSTTFGVIFDPTVLLMIHLYN